MLDSRIAKLFVVGTAASKVLPKWIDVKTVLRHTGFSRPTLMKFRMLDSRDPAKFPEHFTINNKIYWDRDEVAEWMNAMRDRGRKKQLAFHGYTYNA